MSLFPTILSTDFVQKRRASRLLRLPAQASSPPGTVCLFFKLIYFSLINQRYCPLHEALRTILSTVCVQKDAVLQFSAPARAIRALCMFIVHACFSLINQPVGNTQGALPTILSTVTVQKRAVLALPCAATAWFLISKLLLLQINDLDAGSCRCQQYCPQKLLRIGMSRPGMKLPKKRALRNYLLKSMACIADCVLRTIFSTEFVQKTARAHCACPHLPPARQHATLRVCAISRSKFCSPSSKLPAGRSGCC